MQQTQAFIEADMAQLKQGGAGFKRGRKARVKLRPAPDFF